MGWSRDIGVCTPEDVAAKVDAATAHARGILTEKQSTRRTELLAKFNTGAEVSEKEFLEIKELNAAAAVKMSAEEIALIEKASELAAHGVRVMGGSAHVTLGGSDRIDEQPESAARGVRQTSISVTVSVTAGRGEAPVASAPAQVVDTSVPWEPDGKK